MDVLLPGGRRTTFTLSSPFAYGSGSLSVQCHQLAFLTPGIWPLYASSLKQIRQIPYFLKYACGRPQILQRLYSLVENFCFRCCFTFIDVFAIKIPSYCFANGIPNWVNNSRPSSSVFAVVTTITSIPLILSILSYSISGKINCSLMPSA